MKQPNINAARVVASAYAMLDKRKHGEYVQKILQKGEVAHTHEALTSDKPKTLAEIESEIEALERDVKEIKVIELDPSPLAPRARTKD